MKAALTKQMTGSLTALFEGREAELVDIPLIQPADPFLDMAGEDLRRRIFLTENENGDSLCLRPEFTIPVCRNHIALNAATPKRYGYFGEVFRQRRDGGNEFMQAGIEDLGAGNEAQADARSVTDALAAIGDIIPDVSLETVMGDQAVFASLLKALNLPQGWRKKLLRSFGERDTLLAMLDDIGTSQMTDVVPDTFSALVAEANEGDLAQRIETEMRSAGISPVAGRTPSEIARRLIEKQDLANYHLSDAAVEQLRLFLDIKVPLNVASITLRAFAADHNLDISFALQRFEERARAIAAKGIDTGRIFYDASFGRPLDYYTGLVYEIRHGEGDSKTVLAGGGRYDRLLNMLGAEEPIPGVGFSLWLDRLEKIMERSA